MEAAASELMGPEIASEEAEDRGGNAIVNLDKYPI
jgi:hypothetical protein